MLPFPRLLHRYALEDDFFAAGNREREQCAKQWTLEQADNAADGGGGPSAAALALQLRSLNSAV
jgi:hypothetical protein